MSTEKKNLDPETNVIQVSNKRDNRFFMFLAKIFLNKFDTVELHSLGEAIQTSIVLAENLQRYGYVTISSCQTQSIEPVQKNEENPTQQPRRKNVKMIISLKRTANYKTLVGETLRR